MSSNWRSQQVAEEYLEQFKVPVLSDIDTRALVRHLRDHGVMRGVVSTLESDAEKLVAKANSIPKMDGTDLAKEVSTKRPYVWEVGERSHEPVAMVGVKDEPARFHVVAYDFGIKQNILRKLRGEGCRVTVVPAQTLAEDVLALKPDGVFLSNGPGDPEPCTYAVDSIRRLMGRQPIFGICLGHQLTGIALGGKTFKLKFGHHGGNHPVKQLSTGKIEITAHNHNFAVDPDSLPESEVDHLQATGDPRGELIALSLAMTAGNHDAGLAMRRGELHARARAAARLRRPRDLGRRLRALALARGAARQALAAADEMWRHPSLALLSELAIDMGRWGDLAYMPRLVELLPRSLRALVHTSVVGDTWRDLGALCQLPRLEELAFVGSAAFVQLAHPALRRLDVALHMPFAHVVALSPAALPRATELVFRATAQARDFDYLVDVLVSTGWLVRVTELGLVGGDLTTLGIAQLEAGLGGLPARRARPHRDAHPRRQPAPARGAVRRAVAPSLVDTVAEAYVEHTGKPEWGRGHVVRRYEGKVEIEFPAVGRRWFRADATCLRFTG